MAKAGEQYHCVTQAPHVGTLLEIKSQFGVCAAYDPATTPEAQRPPFVGFDAVWDTGATHCAVTQKVVDACGLKPFTLATVNTANGPVQRPVFLLNLAMYQGPMIYGIAATLGDFTDSDLLVGMNVITFGDFAITNRDGHTVFSFRIPSQETIDYVKDANAAKAAMMRQAKPSVNPASRRRGGRR